MSLNSRVSLVIAAIAATLPVIDVGPKLASVVGGLWGALPFVVYAFLVRRLLHWAYLFLVLVAFAFFFLFAFRHGPGALDTLGYVFVPVYLVPFLVLPPVAHLVVRFYQRPATEAARAMVKEKEEKKSK